MSITEAIRLLEALEKRYGPGVQVWFDCPKCKEAYTPTTVASEIRYEPRVIVPAGKIP